MKELEATYEDEGGFEGVKWWNAEKRKYNIIQDQGTIVYFCGMHQHDSTWCKDARGKSFSDNGYCWYINKRFYDLNCVISSALFKNRTHYSIAHGFDYESLYLGFKKLEAIDFDGFKILTYVRKESLAHILDPNKYRMMSDRFNASSYNNGFIAVKYKNELYNLETGKRASRQWGIIADEVMSQVKIIVVPPEYDPKTNYGVFPNEGRDTLMMEDGSH